MAGSRNDVERRAAFIGVATNRPVAWRCDYAPPVKSTHRSDLEWFQPYPGAKFHAHVFDMDADATNEVRAHCGHTFTSAEIRQAAQPEASLVCRQCLRFVEGLR